MRRRVALLAFVVAACGLIPGIQQAEAIDIALRSTDVEQPVVTQVREGRLHDLRSNANEGNDPIERQNRVVWAVTMVGTASHCRPSPQGGTQCFGGPATSTVFLDRDTGEVIALETTIRQ